MGRRLLVFLATRKGLVRSLIITAEKDKNYCLTLWSWLTSREATAILTTQKQMVSGGGDSEANPMDEKTLGMARGAPLQSNKQMRKNWKR